MNWPCDHFTRLSPAEIHRRLKESITRQVALVGRIDADLVACAEDHRLEGRLRAFRDSQRDLLRKFARGAWH